jgi:hypothetical protein
MTGHPELQARILAAVAADDRIVGCLDYGSTSEGRGDRWSDLDLSLFIRDDDLAGFEADWKAWVAQFGDLLLAYVGGVGHPWVTFAGQPLPMRVDFSFHAASSMDALMPTLPNAPTSADAMVLHDETGGRLTELAANLVGQSQAPDDLHGAFDQICGDLWTYFQRTYVRLLRGEVWCARHEFNFIIMGNLLALLRLESGNVDRMKAASAAAQIEQDISAARLAQLDGCIPGPTGADLLAAMHRAALLTADVCRTIAQRESWAWPAPLAEQVVPLFETRRFEEIRKMA